MRLQIALILSLFIIAACEGPKGQLDVSGANGLVIGEDDRVQSKDRESVDTRVGLLISKEGRCTGTLVGPSHVLTAAHCVYDLEKKAFVTDIEFHPGRYQQIQTDLFFFKAKRIYYLPEVLALKDVANGTILDRDIPHDLALIELDVPAGHRPAGDLYGYYGLGYLDTFAKLKGSFTSYPGDKEIYTQWHQKSCSFWFDSKAANLLATDCDSYVGASGTAIIKDELVVGVFSAESAPLKTNYGLALSKRQFTALVQIRNNQEQAVFASHDLTPQPSEIRFYVRNRCNEDLRFSYGALVDGQPMVKKNFYVLPKNYRSFVETSMNGQFLLYAETFDGAQKFSLPDHKIEFFPGVFIDFIHAGYSEGYRHVEYELICQ